jgi:catechol 2,3-dioxygenase-like lactoylglutathione lyase family enzyme
MKTHLNLATANLEASIAFYRTLLQAAPAKHFDDYALFVTENPGLELALDLNRDFAGSHGAHFGIAVDSVDAVQTAIDRFTAAGFRTRVEREETCCYANQTKVWVTDPDARRWEVYTVLAETGEVSSCCAGSDSTSDCCA